MLYTSPTYNGKPYVVPVVCKNKDYLVGYLNGVDFIEYALFDILKSMKIELDINNIDLFLDSSRFNDIMDDGRREGDLTDEEKKNLFIGVFKNRFDNLNKKHVENNIDYVDVLRIECQCGLGFYSWKKYEEIPENIFKCMECGRVLIDYTDHDDYEYEFDDGGCNENSKKD